MPHALQTYEDGSPDYGAVTTGSMAADYVSNCGGFPRARITEVSGWEASGKTTLGLSACARAVAALEHVTYIDIEQAMDFDYAKAQGVDFLERNKALYLNPNTFEETIVAIDEVIEHEASDLIVLDSVSALIPKRIFDGDIDAQEGIAERARMLSRWLPRLIQQARSKERKPAIVMINQLRDKIPGSPFEARFGPKTVTSGGNAIRFYSSLRMEMTQVRKGFIKREAEDPFRPGKVCEIPVANEHRVKVNKNKVGSAYQDAPVWIRYDDRLNLWGIDNVQTLLDMACSLNTFEKRAGGYFVIEEAKLKGEEAAHEYLLRNPEICARAAATLKLDWNNYRPLTETPEALAPASEEVPE